MVEHVVSLGVSLFLSIYVARYLGPTQFGLLSYAQSFVGLFALIATLGLDEIVIRDLVNEPNKRDLLLGTTFILKFIGAFLLLGILIIAVQFTSNDAFTNMLIFIIASGVLFQSFNVIDFYFRSQVLSKYVVFAKIIRTIFYLVFTLWLVFSNAALQWFAILATISGLIFSVALVFSYSSQKLSLFKWEFKKNVAYNLLKESWPLMLSLAVVSLYINIDKVMIQEMLGSKATGEYTVASKLSEAWYFLPTIVVGSLFPAIINAKKTNMLPQI